MENVADALHIAFAVFVFATAIFLAFATFSQAREVADVVLYTNDRTNFEEHLVDSNNVDRIVGLETVIPAIRGYITDNEGYSIHLIDKKGGHNIDYTFDIKEQTYQLKDYLISGSSNIALLGNSRVRVGQVINSPSALKQYLKDALKEITKLYNETSNSKEIEFKETYSEEIISGGRTQVADGEQVDKIYFTELDGVVIEKINTETKVKITYERTK